MNKYSYILFLFLFLTILLLGAVIFTTSTPNTVSTLDENILDKPVGSVVEKKEVKLPETLETYVISQKEFVGQTFNNCGPASLSMVYSLLGVSVSQGVLAERLRPFNNPLGGVDDKSVFPEEFIEDAGERGFLAMERPNGTTSLIESLVAQNIPVIVRTWLNTQEDIGHFRVVRGYDRLEKTFIMDDSYNGPNIQMGYTEFNSLWQPFNYSYIIVYPKEKKEIVEQIVLENKDRETAFRNALTRVEKEKAENKDNAYPAFNIVTAKYHLGDYQGAINEYEQISENLPPRMFWYQLEPLRAYLAAGNYEKVFSMTDSVLQNGNLAFSELYEMRGDAYKAQGNNEAALAEYEKAIYYNKNYAQKLSSRIESL